MNTSVLIPEKHLTLLAHPPLFGIIIVIIT